MKNVNLLFYLGRRGWTDAYGGIYYIVEVSYQSTICTMHHSTRIRHGELANRYKFYSYLKDLFVECND